jgi:pimeloyl-ACP methyl ester carboxylesterase
VAVHLANGPVLILHPDTAKLMFEAQHNPDSRGAQDPDSVRIPTQLEWDGQAEMLAQSRGASRGIVGKVLVYLIEIVTGVDTDDVADIAAERAAAKVDGQVTPGLYRLSRNALNPLKGSPIVGESDIAVSATKPLLVLLHGTFSSTHGSFGKLWAEHPKKVDQLFASYSGVYALDHATLGASPIQNARELAAALPNGAVLHLLSHSRGGLVGEVMAKVCGGDTNLLSSFSQLAPGDTYKSQREDLQALIGLVTSKRISVKRFVRVACPARGTLLASTRLDAYLSVLKWSMELANIPVAPALVDLLAKVAQRRTEPQMMPGLAAQIPRSPLIDWLHTFKAPLAGELRVIAGDMQADSLLSWLKTLMSDLYYWKDNDLVVQTSSMYGGSPRAGSASFLLNRGGAVSHFSYFSNERTAAAVVEGLTADNPRDFSPIGPMSWRGEDASGSRGRPGDKPLAHLPAVFLLPGILGSNLKVGEQRVWLGWHVINGLSKLAYQEGAADSVTPDGAVAPVYGKLLDYLAQTHEVIEFGYDWRVPLEGEAQRLGARVKAALDARAGTTVPVRILAHSMGGVLARTMQLQCPDVWARMMAISGARLLMLGTPNGGSWAPMQVLSADDRFGNMLSIAGTPWRAHESRALMANMPGFIQLQAGLLDPHLGLGEIAAWQRLEQTDRDWEKRHLKWHQTLLQEESTQWGIPSEAALAAAKRLRRALDAQDLKPWATQLVMVLGDAQYTPDGFRFNAQTGFDYMDVVHAGDGRVTVQNALLPGVRAYQLSCAHGDLPKQTDAFAEFVSLLETGQSSKLAPYSASVRRSALAPGEQPAPASVPSRPARGKRPPLPSSVEDVFALYNQATPTPQSELLPPLPVTVINCNLKYTREPLIVGHYASAGLTGSERVVDDMVGGLLGDALKMNHYPSATRSNQVFTNIAANGENPLQLPRPEAAIVVGLGAEGKLSSTGLLETVRHGVLAWAQRLAEQRRGAPLQFEIAAALIGSGGAGMSPGQSAGLIAQGVREANQRLRQRDWPTVSHLHLTELYLDRATDAWRAVQMLAASRPKEFTLTPTINTATGWLRRPLEGGYRSTRYDFISALSQYDENKLPVIAYTLDSKRARAEVRAQATQSALLHELISASSNQPTALQNIGNTLFKLLVPVEMDAYLAGTMEMQIELDSSTAAIPWELLNTERDPNRAGAEEEEPWAIRSKLLRKLRTETYREQVTDATASAYILVIGEPLTDTRYYPRLRGAREEARTVASLLTASLPTDTVHSLIAGDEDPCLTVDAVAVTSALLAHDWRIVHIAGHGEPPLLEAQPQPDRDAPPPPAPAAAPKMLDPRGIVLSNNLFLGPREMKSMRVVPELVFINCCHLGAIDPARVEKVAHLHYDRTRFAATVAEQLIDIGVRCVVVAGWAVDDDAASVFATHFYRSLLNGNRFMDATAAARREARKAAPASSTWAAYQCYGDPDWVFSTASEDANQPAETTQQGFDTIASAQALILALEIAVNESRYKKTPAVQVAEMIRTLESRFGHLWQHMGSVCEAFAQAWAEAGETNLAIGWFQRALAANDGSASLHASEQLGELKARRAWAKVYGAAPANRAATLNSARKQTRNAINLLSRVHRLQPTLGRASLCGMAYKYMAWIELMANNEAAEQKALQKMQEYFTTAEQLVLANDPAHGYAPGLQRLAAQLFGPQADAVQADILQIQALLKPLVKDNPDFENVAALIISNLYQAVLHGKLKPAANPLLGELTDLKRRVPGVLKWRELQMDADFVLDRYFATATEAEKAAVMQFKEETKSWATAPV